MRDKTDNGNGKKENGNGRRKNSPLERSPRFIGEGV